MASEWKPSELNRRAKYYRLDGAREKKQLVDRAIEMEAAGEDDRPRDADDLT